ncbi:MAG: ATP-binding cassette domain-containing protein [Actinomycetota bacterium]|nr:ATP-binding cassette domain-containing protein [Actinomycetota bacterium]
MLVARDVEVSVAEGVSILGPISLELAPGSLVALMGTSGSGKSTLLHVLAGIAEPSAGSARWAGEPTASAVHALGFVPQRESIHDRLTTREALQYAARLRLDTGAAIEDRVEMVLDELGLTAQADTVIKNLSGGERRRAACGLELVGDPPVLLLDEPTSGLDLVLERRLMQLFRRQAEHGRAVLVATHATTSLDLCDEVVLLEAGSIAFRGSPSHARAHLGEARGQSPAPAQPHLRAAANDPAPASAGPSAGKRSFGLELRVLSGRYIRTLTRERRTLALLVGQAPVIGLLIALIFHPGAVATSSSPLDALELVFLIMTGSIWLGLASASREVVKERGLVEREFDVGVRLDVYVTAKALVLFGLNFIQVLLLAVVALGLQPLGIGATGSLELYGIAVLTAWASTAMGLVVSSVARSVDQAAGAVPLLLMPQLLLAGGLIPLAQMPAAAAVLANVIYARWSYAGLAAAAHLGTRLSQYDFAPALGFNAGFFSLSPGSAAVILLAFTLVGLVGAMFALMRRPPVNP